MNYPAALLLLALLSAACITVDPTYEQDARAAEVAGLHGEWLRSGTLWHGLFESDGGLNPRSSLGLARALFEQGDARGALAIMQPTLRQKSEGERHAELYLLSARCHVRLSEPAEERLALEAGLALASTHHGLLRRMAQLRFERGEISGGAELLGRLFASGVALPAELRRLARALVTTGAAERALEIYRAAIEGGAQDLFAEAGELAGSQERFEEAAVWLQCAADQNPQDAQVQYLLGHLAQRAGQREQARKYLHRSLELDPTNTDCLLDLARLHVAEGARLAAVSLLESSLVWEQEPERRARIKTLLGQLVVGDEPARSDEQ